MHELAITESIVAAVRDRLPDIPIRRIRVEVGQLSGVVADALRFSFELAAQGTTLEGAELDIISSPGLATCRDCGAEFDSGELFALCEVCGSAEVEVTGGRQLLIKEVEVL
jgi:hydrogenase nickel incorporation protein HypA/HybF